MFDYSPEREKGISLGLSVLGAVFLVYLITSGSPLRLISLNGLLIVLGGTVAAACIHFPLSDFALAKRAIIEVFWEKSFDPRKRIRYLAGLSRSVKNSGLVALDRAATEQDDLFMRLALQVASDSLPEQQIRTILSSEIRASETERRKSIQIFESLGVYAPALGLIGTLLGLSQMLGEIGNPVALGEGMSVAVLTTLYGAALSNLFFLPIAGKLERRLADEVALKELTIEGVISLSKEENPVYLEQRLSSFSSQNQQVIGL